MSSNADDTLTYADLIPLLDLQSIVYYEVSGRLREGDDFAPAPDEGGIPTESNWSVRLRHEGLEFGVRIRVETEMSMGETVVDIAAEYTSEHPLELNQDTVYEYVNNVALMQLFPYIREANMTMSARVLGTSVLMPVFERGQIAFTPGAQSIVPN